MSMGIIGDQHVKTRHCTEMMIQNLATTEKGL